MSCECASRHASDPCTCDCLACAVHDDHVITQSETETPCLVREDQQHCDCWYDGSTCRACGDMKRLRGALKSLFDEIRSRFAESESGYQDMTSDLRKVMKEAEDALKAIADLTSAL